MRYAIRPFAAQDAAYLQDALYDAVFVPEGETPPPCDILTQPELRLYTENFGALPDDTGLIAETDHRPVGAAWARIVPDYGHIDDDTPSIAISVRGDCRGQGIGSALLAALLDALREKGYAAASLSVQKANYAVRMYCRMGFAVCHENEEEYIMRIALQPTEKPPAS